MLTKPIVVDTARPFDPPSTPQTYSSPGALNSSFGTSRVGRYPPSSCRRSCIYTISGESCRRPVERPILRRLLRNRNIEPLHKRRQRLIRQLLLGVRRIARLRRAQPVALHRLRQDHRRPALMLHRPLVGVVNLRRIMPAAMQPQQLFVGIVLHQLQQLRILPEEVLPQITRHPSP